MPPSSGKNKLIALFEHRTVQVFFTTLAVSLFLFLALKTCIKAHRAAGYDFHSYLVAAKTIWHGHSPYVNLREFPYLYPLFLGFILIPMTELSYSLACALWLLFNYLALAHLLKRLCDWITPHADLNGKRVWAGVHCAIWLLIPALQNDFYNGQVNLIVLWLCALFFHAYARDKNNLGSLCLAIAIAIKLYPAMFLFFLLIRGEYRIFLQTVVFSAVLCLIPGILIGSSIFPIYQNYLYEMVVHQFQGILGDEAFRIKLSVPGILFHYLPSQPRPLWLHLLLCAPVFALLIPAIRAYRPDRGLALFSVLCIGILLVQPISEMHHLVLLIPAAMLFILRMLDRSDAFFDHRFVALSLFSFFFYTGRANKPGPLLFMAVVVLFVAVLWEIRKQEDNPRQKAE